MLDRLLGLSLSVSVTGCGTVLSFGMSHDPEQSFIYSGVRADVAIPLVVTGIIEPEPDTGEQMPPWAWLGTLLILDLPLSFAADTLLLPLTVTDHVRKRSPGAAEVRP